MTPKVFLALVAAFAILHQDAWLWNDGRLLFGFLPTGLAYHVAYSLATALLWAVAARFAWPPDVETSGPPTRQEENRRQ